MPCVIRIDPTFESWRSAARTLLHKHIPPSDVSWIEEGSEQDVLPGLLEPQTERQFEHAATPSIPRAFVGLARHAACHRDPHKWRVLYRILWRLVHDSPHLLSVDVDDEVSQLKRMDRQVQQDAHKMTAFVRFRRVLCEEGEHYIAWHRPDHLIVKLVAPFFVERFRAMRWSILTPDCSVHWDTQELCFSEGAPRHHAPEHDELEDLWRTYYGAVFNPARVNLTAMRASMPLRFWDTLPETRVVAQLLSEAPQAVERMVQLQQQANSAKSFLPADMSIPYLRDAASRCRGCDLYRCASQTVFGQGPVDARVVLIGEQPGDVEDLQGLPFVGPAGGILDRALAEAGLSRNTLYLPTQSSILSSYWKVSAGNIKRHVLAKSSLVAPGSKRSSRRSGRTLSCAWERLLRSPSWADNSNCSNKGRYFFKRDGRKTSWPPCILLLFCGPTTKPLPPDSTACWWTILVSSPQLSDETQVDRHQRKEPACEGCDPTSIRWTGRTG